MLCFGAVLRRCNFVRCLFGASAFQTTLSIRVISASATIRVTWARCWNCGHVRNLYLLAPVQHGTCCWHTDGVVDGGDDGGDCEEEEDDDDDDDDDVVTFHDSLYTGVKRIVMIHVHAPGGIFNLIKSPSETQHKFFHHDTCFAVNLGP